jgi:glycosyltransferase involved in cell wall biosynthesis
MKVLYVLNSGKLGGMELHTVALAAGIVRKGNKVFVWCPEGELIRLFLDMGVSVTKRRIRFELDFVYIFNLYSFLKKNKINVLHAHEPKAVFNSLIAGYFAGTKVKISHTHTPISSWKINGLKKLVDKKIYTLVVNMLSDKEIALTESVSVQKKKEGIKEEKLTIINNALDTSNLLFSTEEKENFRNSIRELYLIPSDAFVFGCVGRLTEEKGHRLLIKAFKNFLEKNIGNEKFYLVIAGGGHLEKDLRKLIKELDIEGKVVITGVFGDKDKIKIYSSFDVFIFPSLAEGFGLSLIEAMYLQIPVISSDIEVLKEVGGESVKYFNSDSPEDLTRGMEELIGEMKAEKKLDLSEAKLRVESIYSMKSFINNYLRLYKSLL